MIKVADLNGDRHLDIVLGTTFNTQTRLFLGDEDGWTDVTRDNLPAAKLSVGDLEPGDVDRDGDLDLVLADWGGGSPMTNQGGRVRLWLNDGEARFRDVSRRQMPAFTNNYDFAPVDLDGDGFLDLVTVNDGDSRPLGLAERVFRNDGRGRFVDVTEKWWPEESNPGYDDNIVVALDVESDGDADFVIGSLDGPDRLLVNDGQGRLTLEDDVFDGDPSRGTLGMALADLDGDRRIDVVESQGEVPGFEEERVYFGTEVLPPDTAPPVVRPRPRAGVRSPVSTTTARRTFRRTSGPSRSPGRAAGRR